MSITSPTHTITITYRVTVPHELADAEFENVKAEIESEIPQEITGYLTVTTGKDEDGDDVEEEFEINAEIDGDGLTWQTTDDFTVV